jgi:hypothetical protein
MGEGGAAPIHTISAALQDALHSAGIYVTDSFNNGDSIFRALEQRKAGRPVGNVRTEQRATRKGRATASPGKSGGGRR